jgi:hypothetical protein
MNVTYEFEVTALCPADTSVRNIYHAKVESATFIWAEQLQAFAAELANEAFSQEAITERCAEQFSGATVTLTGQHGGVRITSTATTQL